MSLDGEREAVHAGLPDQPSGLGWLPDGTLLVVSMCDRKLLREERGRLVEHADLSPVAPAEWLDRSWIERVVFDGPSRVMDVGVAQRLFTGATRRAIEVRDRQCFHEFCEEPASKCQADHIQPYSAGGPTTTRNGRMACGFHNRRRNRGP